MPCSDANTVRSPRHVREAVVAWSRAAVPREACGLLLGGHDGDTVLVSDARHARNHSTDADAYHLDVADFLAAWRDADAAGLEVVGVWHSHPGGGAAPSHTDHAAAWPELVYLIAGLSPDGAAELRCWQRRGPDMVELRLETTP